MNGGTAGCPANGAFLVQTTSLGSDHATQIAPATTTYYDALSRKIASEAQGFDGTVIHADSQYDANGRMYRTSQPYFVGAATIYWTTNTYDALGRVVATTHPDNGQITVAYHGLTTSITDANNHTTTTVENDQGLKASVTDAMGKTANYVYDAYGELLSVTDSAGNVTTNNYDSRGRKTSTSDPDKGAWSYGYDVLNEVVSQTNARNQTSSVTYDVLGRMTQRTEADLTSTWTYDTAAHGVGALATATTNTTYNRALTYDTLGRPSTVALSVNGYNYSYATSYDSVSGKIATVSYPSGLAIRYAYNAYGYQSQVKDNVSGQVYWTGNVRDAYLNLTSETAGNGVTTTRGFTPQTGRISTIQAGTGNAVANFAYQFDLIGNLTQRVDSDLTRTDTFAYDALNRLQTYSIAGGANQTMGYDALGDITSKPGIGTYAYPAAGQARPHAVSSISGTVRGVVNPTFSYDADGNTLTAPGMTAAYTSFDMASSVSNSAGGTLWGGFSWGHADWSSTLVALAYDSEHQRMEMSGPAGATYYFNDPVSGVKAEWFVPTSGATQWRDYVMADGRMVAERTAVTGGSTTWQYFIADHLGSIAVIADASGNVQQRMIYDPWGVQLDQNSNQLCGTGATTRGFTGEEQFPVDCLVNLNARLYDPVLGRFLSGDPVIGDLYDPQTLNRYGYVLNNPLSLTDVNGDCPICVSLLIEGIAALFVVEVLKTEFEKNPILGDLFVLAEALSPCSLFCAAEVSGIVAGVTSGNIGKGLEAAALTFAEGEAFNAVGGKLGGADALKAAYAKGNVGFLAEAFVAHGVVGGTFSVLQGGKFGSGFLAAGVSELATPWVHTGAGLGDKAEGTIEEAIIGGTTSVLAGGKFENGAVTGAFGYLFNSLYHDGPATTCGAFNGAPATCNNAGSLQMDQAKVTGAAMVGSVFTGVAAGFGLAAEAFAGVGQTARTFMEDALEGVCCFAAGTLVSTSTGLRVIEQINVGDLVLSRDPKTGLSAYKPVVSLIHRHHREIYDVKFQVRLPDGATRIARFETTDDHPWRSADGRWLTTLELMRGGEILTAYGPAVRVLSVIKTGRTAPTFNLDVADYHTYFVGEDRVWVHNACPPGMRDASMNELRNSAKRDGFDSVEEWKQKELQLNSRDQIAVDKNGNLYSYPRQGSGSGQSLGIKIP